MPGHFLQVVNNPTSIVHSYSHCFFSLISIQSFHRSGEAYGESNGRKKKEKGNI